MIQTHSVTGACGLFSTPLHLSSHEAVSLTDVGG